MTIKIYKPPVLYLGVSKIYVNDRRLFIIGTPLNDYAQQQSIPL